MELHSVLCEACPYSVQMRENADQKYSEYGHFLRSADFCLLIQNPTAVCVFI